ncbi:MAG TPA: type III-A CRISPR-associated protein Csm2 [Phycisphaerales bacterium]|nr:type III-A CRISPR-associated protein Csm2 [Phycisphaerales bacterium]HRQ74545.1 type III-A CRISPR-associated protein Csm2 [Phycisphaerales bacterium]
MTSYGGQRSRQGGGGVRSAGGSFSGKPTYGGRERDQPDDKIANHWHDYLTNGYFDSDGNLRSDYVSRDKVEPLIHKMAHGDPKLTTGQLRRFFGHCRALETQLKSGTATWDQLRTKFAFLDVAAADAYGKAQRKIPGLFYDFILCNVAAVKTEKDFRQGFLAHFEALVGFGSLHLQKERN